MDNRQRTTDNGQRPPGIRLNYSNYLTTLTTQKITVLRPLSVVCCLLSAIRCLLSAIPPPPANKLRCAVWGNYDGGIAIHPSSCRFVAR